MSPKNFSESQKLNTLTSAARNADVDIVIIAFNSQHIIGQLLASLPDDANILVVDNASDVRLDAITENGSVKYIREENNLGFGKASNLGASLGNREFIFFINPDSILHPKAFETMVETLRLNPTTAIVGPRLIYPDGTSQWRYSSVIHPVVKQQTHIPNEPIATCCVPLLTGSALLCRRDAFEEVGGFDEEIFLYHEDDDLCRRLTNRGWSLIYEPSAVVTHASGQSSPSSLKLTRFKAKQKLTSLAYVSTKYSIPIDLAKERRRSYKRLLISLLTFHRERFAAALGRLDAIRDLMAKTDGKSSSGYHAEDRQDFGSDMPQSRRKFFW